MVRFFIVFISMFLSSTLANAQLEQLQKQLGLGNASTLSDSKVVSGLKEALKVGTENP